MRNHVYGECSTAFLREELTCQWDIGNVLNRHAVAVETVGHMPKKISRIYSLFLQHSSLIIAVVTGRQRYSSNLVQGGARNSVPP